MPIFKPGHWQDLFPYFLHWYQITFDTYLLANPIYVSVSVFILLTYIVQYICIIASCKYSIFNADHFTHLSHLNTVLYSEGGFFSTVAIFYLYGNWYVALIYLLSMQLINLNKSAGSSSFFMLTLFSTRQKSVLDTRSCGTYFLNNAYNAMCFIPLSHLVVLPW